MSIARSREIQRQLAEELRGLARVLENENIIRDASELTRAADNCRTYQIKKSHFWNYNVSKFNIGPINLKQNSYRHCRPKNLKSICIELNVSLTGMCLPEKDTSDPFTELTVDLEIIGDTDDEQVLSCAMHLDRHIEGNDPEESPLFAHPGYHFHFGGNKMWDKQDAEFGSILLLESPRLAHPPLDGILAVDFILSNYMPAQWRHLRETNANYRSIIKSAQARYWRPYAIASVNNWERMPFPTEWSSDAVWPHLC